MHSISQSRPRCRGSASTHPAQTPGLVLAVDERAIADAIGLSVPWLRKDRAGKRLIPFFRVGRCVRYSPEAVRRALAELQEGGAK